MTHSNPDRWEQLFELLAPVHDRARVTARRLAASHDEGDDLFHDALLRAWERLPGLRDPARFPGWFYAVLLSVHRNRARRAFWKRFIAMDAWREGDAREPASTDASADAQTEQLARMRAALGTLPAVQREAVVLHDIDGFKMEEIAQMQDVTVSAVKTRVARGRARLRRYYRRATVHERATPEANGQETSRNG
jgi:RNA polymerase sigma-70 factor (ECF subfamily)